MVYQDVWKGWPILVLVDDTYDPPKQFRFGVRNASLILENLAEIKKFVKNHSEDEDDDDRFERPTRIKVVRGRKTNRPRSRIKSARGTKKTRTRKNPRK